MHPQDVILQDSCLALLIWKEIDGRIYWILSCFQRKTQIQLVK